MRTLKSSVAVTLIIILLMADAAVPVMAATDSNLIKPLIGLPEPYERPIQKAIANLTTETKVKPEVLGLTDNTAAQKSAGKRTPLTVTTDEIADFKADEEVTITVNNPDKASFTTKVINAEGEEQPVEVHTITSGATTELLIDDSNQFTPGKYTIEITDQAGQTIKQDFTWGVLAINTDKSIYKTGETAQISLAVLDDKGEMVCDANVLLKITKPDGSDETLSTSGGQIITNQECHSKAFTLKPDYQTSYAVGDSGEYKTEVSAQTKNGFYTIHDSFFVQDEIAFDVKRTSATRIYPPLMYPVTMEITANQDFTGTVTETVPASFAITPASEANSYDKMNTLYMNAQNDPANKLQQQVLGTSTGLVMPFDGTFPITQGFGTEMTDDALKNFYSHYGLGGHDGIDFGLPMGTPLYAVDDGNILVAGVGDYGITIVIQHAWGRSYYGHLSKVSVEPNTSVTKGSFLGYSGNTGESTGPHLHFGMKPENPDVSNGYAGKVDPLAFLPQLGTNTARALNLTNLQAVLSATDSAEKLDPTPTPQTPIQASLTEPAVAPETKPVSIPLPPVKDYTVQDDQIRKDVSYSTNPRIEKVKVIKWQVSLKKGETTTLSYTYKSPQVSPQFYTAGPLRFFEKDTQKVVFEEKRIWQIAADAVGVAWYNKSWQYRKSVTIDSGQISGTLTNFPVLINLSSDSQLAGKAQTDADDILFTTSDGKTKLSHEIESYNSGTGALVAWVKVPTVTSLNDTDIYMYYGNPAASSQQSATSVWDSNYRAVWHLKENPATTCFTTREVCDSTSNANHGDANGSMTIANQITGQVNGALDFDGSNDNIDFGNIAAINNISNLTATAWIKRNSLGAQAFVIKSSALFTDTVGFAITTTGFVSFEVAPLGGQAFGAAPAPNDTNWHFYALQYDGTQTGNANRIRGYIDGVQQTLTFTGTIPASTTTDLSSFTIGSEATAFGSQQTDEVRLSTNTRATGWITTEYNNQNSPSTFYALGSEETYIYAPTNKELMRHGKFFDSSGSEQPFAY